VTCNYLFVILWGYENGKCLPFRSEVEYSGGSGQVTQVVLKCMHMDVESTHMHMYASYMVPNR